MTMWSKLVKEKYDGNNQNVIKCDWESCFTWPFVYARVHLLESTAIWFGCCEKTNNHGQFSRLSTCLVFASLFNTHLFLAHFVFSFVFFFRLRDECCDDSRKSNFETWRETKTYSAIYIKMLTTIVESKCTFMRTFFFC